MSKVVCLKRIIDGGLGAESPAAGGSGGEASSRWAIFWEKPAILMPLDYNFYVFRTIFKN